MLPQEDWLPQAQRLAVGMKVRVFHKRERRPNLVVSNQPDRWSAYCQACKEGGVLRKEHVLLTDVVKTPAVLTLPTDIQPVLGSEFEQAIGKFLASKHMMFPYLPTLYYSQQARRLMIKDEAMQWHGRDLTDRSMAKWLHYGASFSGTVAKNTILCEDMFSMWKIEFALRETIRSGWGVVCTLGTSPSQAAVFALRNCGRLVWAYDADKAGDDGYTLGRKRMQVFVAQQSRVRPPEGLDPKDMDCTDIREMIRRVDYEVSER